MLATQLVGQLISDGLTLAEFVSAYDNFYHFEALDGHEANAEQLKVQEKFSVAIEFHCKVQTEVIDKFYVGADISKDLLVEVNRIDEAAAMTELQNLCAENKLAIVFRSLQPELNGQN